MIKDKAEANWKVLGASLPKNHVGRPPIRTYLSNLPDDLLIVILHYTDGNTNPYGCFAIGKFDEWNKFKNETRLRACLFFARCSVFREVSRTMFHKIQIVDGYVIQLKAREGLMQLGTGHYTTDTLFVLQIIRNCADSITSIQVDYSVQNDINYSRTINFVIENCRNVNQMAFVLRFPSSQLSVSSCKLLDYYAPQLRILYWTTKFIPNGIPDFSKCAKLTKFTFVGHLTPQFLSHIPSIGHHLKYLKIYSSARYIWRRVMTTISRCCHSLNHVFLPGTSVVSEVGIQAYISFLCWFGGRLHNACLDPLNLCHVSKVLRDCPNLNVDLCAPRLFRDWRFMCDLTVFRVHSLRVIVGIENIHNLCYVNQVMTKAVNLAMLKVVGFNNAPYIPNLLFECLFSSPLNILELNLYGVNATAKNMQRIALATSRLRSLEITLNGACESYRMFRCIFLANPNLHTFAITDPRRGLPALSEDEWMLIIRDLAFCFWNNKFMQYFELMLNVNLAPGARDVEDDLLLCRGVRHYILLYSTNN